MTLVLLQSLSEEATESDVTMIIDDPVTSHITKVEPSRDENTIEMADL